MGPYSTIDFIIKRASVRAWVVSITETLTRDTRITALIANTNDRNKVVEAFYEAIKEYVDKKAKSCNYGTIPWDREGIALKRKLLNFINERYYDSH